MNACDFSWSPQVSIVNTCIVPTAAALNLAFARILRHVEILAGRKTRDYKFMTSKLFTSSLFHTHFLPIITTSPGTDTDVSRDQNVQKRKGPPGMPPHARCAWNFSLPKRCCQRKGHLQVSSSQAVSSLLCVRRAMREEVRANSARGDRSGARGQACC